MDVTPARHLLGAAALIFASLGPASAEDGAVALVITVHPSGYEDAIETLDEKLARRERSFRFICLGCVRAEGRVDSTTPFRPIQTLNAPQLNAALAAERGTLGTDDYAPALALSAGRP